MRLIRDRGETVTIVRLSDDKGEETIVASDILCLISPVEGQYEHWQATFEVANEDIRKGDLLRRDNGLEMQVLRVNTGKFSRGDEITYLDLKEYDRVPQSFQIDVEDTLTDNLYCHRKLGPPPKPRLCYNDNLSERSIRWEPNEEDSLLSLKHQLFLRHSAVKVHKRNCVAAITSVKTRSQNGSSSSLKMRTLCLPPRISNPARQPSGSHILNTSLGG